MTRSRRALSIGTLLGVYLKKIPGAKRPENFCHPMVAGGGLKIVFYLLAGTVLIATLMAALIADKPRG